MGNIYTDGEYMDQNPSWHEEDAPWKAAQIRLMLQRQPIKFKSVAEIGCGVGAILADLSNTLQGDLQFSGYDIAGPAIDRARQKESGRLHFHNEDLLQKNEFFDLLLIMDVIEHVPDYLGFLKGCKTKAKYKIYHIPLDIHASSVIRGSVISARESVGHIQYFTAESALASLSGTGHKIIDSFLTDGGLALTSLHPSLKRSIANVPRRIISAFSKKWAARLMGGYSLLVLTE